MARTFSISKRPGECGKGKPFGVIDSETGKVFQGGCHKTRAEALAHQRALFANIVKKEEEKAREDVIAGLVGKATLPGYLAAKEGSKLTQGERMKLARAGMAMPDGSFPIRHRTDLEHAIESFGRASDPAAAKAWIKKRAAALGAESMLPANWK